MLLLDNVSLCCNLKQVIHIKMPSCFLVYYILTLLAFKLALNCMINSVFLGWHTIVRVYQCSIASTLYGTDLMVLNLASGCVTRWEWRNPGGYQSWISLISFRGMSLTVIR